MVTFIIYKIYCDSLSDIYIGSTNNLNRRIVYHKKDCYNKNLSKYNNKLYTFIRDNVGFDNWKFKILESFNEERKKKEQYYINKLNPSLNTYRAYRSVDDLQEFKRIKSQRQY